MMQLILAGILIVGYWRTKTTFSAWMLLFAGVMIDQALTDAINGKPLFDLQRLLQDWPLWVGSLMVTVVLVYYGRRLQKRIELDREYFRSRRPAS